jgi:hypothetical protein
LEYLEQSLRNKNEMVVYEAARAICSLRNATAKELTPAITGILSFLFLSLLHEFNLFFSVAIVPQLTKANFAICCRAHVEQGN